MTELIDRERLERLAAQISRPVLDRMLLQFAERLADSGRALSAAAAADDPVALRHEAHKLVGVAGTFGADAVAEAARVIEKAVDEGRIEAARDGVAPLLGLIDATASRLRMR